MAWNPPDAEVVAVSGPDGVALLDVGQIAVIAFTPDPPGVQGRVEHLRRLMWAVPFSPYVLRLADGRRFPVATAECLGISLDGGSVGIFDAGESFQVFDADEITDIEPGPAARPAPTDVI
jgi:hypothetical protein